MWASRSDQTRTRPFPVTPTLLSSPPSAVRAPEFERVVLVSWIMMGELFFNSRSKH